NFGASKPIIVKHGEPQEYNTPFLQVGKGNLSLPYIQSTVSGKGIIYFGQDNLYPQLLNQMYYTSPLHGAIIDYTVNAVIGGGVDIKTDGSVAQEVDKGVFLRKIKAKGLFPALCRDYYMHRRVHFWLSFSDSGKFLKMKRVYPSKI